MNSETSCYMRRAVIAQAFLLCAIACVWLQIRATQIEAQTPPQTAFNHLDNLADGAFISAWLISAPQPSEVDAGTYENFQRFNIERLPEQDWLAPYGGAARIQPQAGVANPVINKSNALTAVPDTANNPSTRTDMPEVSAANDTAKVQQQSAPLVWKLYRAASPQLDFNTIYAADARQTLPGTAYAATYLSAARDEELLLETNRFLGSIWFNDEKIYDGFQLAAPHLVAVHARIGRNVLILRSTALRGDAWRKDSGWSANLRVWHMRRVGSTELYAGALRPTGFFTNKNGVARESLTLAILNKQRQPARNLAIEVKATDASAKENAIAKLDAIESGELREVKLDVPAVTANTSAHERTIRARVEINGAQIVWNASWKSSAVPSDGTIFYLEGFHVDPVYLHDQREYARITLSNTNQYLNSLRADPAYGLFLSEIDYLKPYDDTHPEDRALLRQAIREGRVGTGGSYNQFNELTIGGESIVRNILYGRGYHEGVLGSRVRALALWDVFGHAPQISQLARKSGFEGIVWSKRITGFPPFFYDYALDGSRLLHRRVDYAYSFSGFGSGKNYDLDALRRLTERKFAEPLSLGAHVDLRLNAADFTPPWTNLAGNAAQWNEARPRIFVTGQAQERYFDSLRAEINRGSVVAPVTSRDKLFFHVGVGAARSDLKIAHRLAENMTLTAERFGALAAVRGARYPDYALDKSWRQILFGSHHDAITGTSSDNALLDLLHGYREAIELSRGALDDALEYLGQDIDTRAPQRLADHQAKDFVNAVSPIPLVIFNPMSWKRTDAVRATIKFIVPVADFVVRDDAGALLPHALLQTKRDAANAQFFNEARIEFVAHDIPSLGYRTFFVYPASTVKRTLTHKVAEVAATATNMIENDFYRITIDPQRGGAVRSIYDKTVDREIVRTSENHFANEIGVLAEELSRKNVTYPAWEFWTTGAQRFSTETSARVSVANEGATHRLLIEGDLPNMRGYRQTIELFDGVKRIDFRTELIEYRGANELFVVNFPLALTNGALVTEDRFGVVTRNASKGFLDFRTSTDKLVSGASVYPAYNWVEYGQTLTLAFQDARGERLASVPFRPVALVRPRNSTNDDMTARIVGALIRRGVSAPPFYDDNDEQRRASLSIEDSTVPRKLNDDVAYHSFRIALGNVAENKYTASLLQQASAAAQAKFNERLARDGFAYLFLYDRKIPEGWPPIPALVIAGRDAQTTQRAVEQLFAPLDHQATTLALSIDALAEKDTPELALISSTQAKSAAGYGVALINAGTPAASLERPATLTLFLMHTAPWPGVNLPFEFVPEHKTHVFNYALYPHAGDWREANSTRVGYDFNNPLIARQFTPHAGTLPHAHSFLTVDAPDVALSALKLGGNPQANFQQLNDATPRTLIARFYETDGRNARATFKLDKTLSSVKKTNLIEEESAAIPFSDSQFAATLDGFGIETYKIATIRQANSAMRNAPALGSTAELVQPVFSRYWMHNAGAAPLGNDPVKITLRPVEQMNALSTFAYDDSYNQGGITTTAVRVSVVNDYQNARVEGVAIIEVAPGWRVVPDRIPYSIEPGGYVTRDVIVVNYPVKRGETWKRASGLVKARMEDKGQTYHDVLEIGHTLKLEWRIVRTDQGVEARVRNPNRQRIEGTIALITPPETWPDIQQGALSKNAPRELGFAVAPGEETTLLFNTSNDVGKAWAIARLVYNGHVEYLRADGIQPVSTQTKK